AGNISECSDGLEYIHDSAQPTIPFIIESIPESPNNLSTEPTLRGLGEPNATIRIYTNETCTPPAVNPGGPSDGAGVFEIGVTVEANSVTPFWVASQDSADNISPCSPAPFLYKHDILTPQSPILQSTTPESPSNTSSTPTVEGEAEIQGTVNIYTSADCSGESIATVYNAVQDGEHFAANLVVAENTTTDLHATVTDEANNVSACTAEPLTYVHDTIPPDPPVLTGTNPESPASDPAPVISGLGEPLAEIRFFANADCTVAVFGFGQVQATGAFAIPAVVGTDQETVIYANATDQAGNVSTCSVDPVTYSNDSSAPETPVLTHTVPASPSTTHTAPTVHGTTDPNVLVTLYTSEGCFQDESATTTSDGSGDFSFDVTVEANTLTMFYANATDEIGNVSVCSDGLPYLHDNEVPDAPVLTGTDPESPGQDPTPEVLGQSEAEIQVLLFTNPDCAGAPVGQGLSDEIGTFAVEAT
ncbi:MAG: hypothetical protein QF464_18220, partial [Myxococcota bacterium]|nr:hypothetical protein [Myxococcota bacterium]